MSFNNTFINFYGRTVGHLGNKAKELVDSLLPRYSINEVFFLQDDEYSFSYINKSYKRVVFEIGFGSGDFIYTKATQNPDTLFIGVEVFLNGVASLLAKLEGRFLPNLKIYNDNVYRIFDKIPPSSIDEIYILFPDPWHKKRHNKRRIINQDNLSFFSKILKKGGSLSFVSDDAGYVSWALENILAHKNFLWRAENSNDIFTPPPKYVETKYHRKALKEGRRIFYIISKNDK